MNNKALIAFGVILLLVVIALLVYFLFFKKSDDGFFQFVLSGLGVKMEQTKPTTEKYTMRVLEDIQKEDYDNNIDYLNNFIDFNINWKNPDTTLLNEKVGYLRLERTMSTGEVINYYIINQDLTYAGPSESDTNILYRPTSVNGIDGIEDSDIASSSDSSFFSPGASVTVNLYGSDLANINDLRCDGIQQFRLYYYVNEDSIERQAAVGTGESVVFQSSDIPSTIYDFDFEGGKKTSQISYNLIEDVFDFNFSDAQLMYERAGTIFKMCFKCAGKGFKSYKWLTINNVNIEIQKTSFARTGTTPPTQVNKSDGLLTSGNFVLPNFINDDVCRIKVVAGNQGVLLEVMQTPGRYLKYSPTAVNNSNLILSSDYSDATEFLFEETTGTGTGTFFLVHRPSDSDAIYFMYDWTTDKVKALPYNDSGFLDPSNINFADYAGFQYVEEISNLDNFETPLVGSKGAGWILGSLTDEALVDNTSNIFIFNYNKLLNWYVTGTITGYETGSSPHKRIKIEYNHVSLKNEVEINEYDFTDKLENSFSSAKDYLFTFEKYTDPYGLVDNLYYIKTSVNIGQRFKYGTGNNHKSEIITQMYITFTGINDRIKLMTDVDLASYNANRAIFRVFNAPKEGAKEFKDLPSTFTDNYSQLTEILLVRYGTDELLNGVSRTTDDYSIVTDLSQNVYLGGKESFFIFR